MSNENLLYSPKWSLLEVILDRRAIRLHLRWDQPVELLKMILGHKSLYGYDMKNIYYITVLEVIA